MTYTIILNRKIDNNLWFEIILIITYIKNIKTTFLFKNKNLNKIYFNKTLKLSYLEVFKYIIYIFINKKKLNLKSKKFKI